MNTTHASIKDGDPTLSPLLGAGEAGHGGGVESPAGTLAGLENFGADAAPKRRVSGQTMLLLAFILIAAGVLYAMRQIGLGPGAAMAGGKDTDAPMLLNNGDHKSLLADLNASRTEQQVPEEKVKKNPFRIDMGSTQADVPLDDGSHRATEAARAEAERVRRQVEARAGQVKQRLAQLQLNGVIGGSSPVARIGGKVYRKGEVVAETFLLREIAQRSVELECDGVVYTLEMNLSEGRP